MKLLLDQDVYAVTARFLNGRGHDVVPVARIGLSQAGDQEILRVAQEQGRILVTRDRDFGGWPGPSAARLPVAGGGWAVGCGLWGGRVEAARCR
jgi:hypothetical protein